MEKLDLKSLDIIANSNDPINRNTCIIEYGYCLKMRELYTDYRKGLINIESCKRHKQEIIREYEECSSCLKVYKEYQKNIIKSDVLRCEITKSNDIMEMLLKCLECISLMTSDEVFYKINARKLGDSIV